MKRRNSPGGSRLGSGELLDLPLDGSALAGPPDPEPTLSRQQPGTDLASDSDPGRSRRDSPALRGLPSAGSASVGQHLVSGCTDVFLHAVLGALMVVLLPSLGVAGALERQWPGLLGFLLSFSLLYFVLSLAFWGQTPGMAWARLRCCDASSPDLQAEDQGLTFSQALMRWFAAVLTLGLAGIPALVAVTGRSFADRLSASSTYRVNHRE